MDIIVQEVERKLVMKGKAYAKINISLDVIGKRDDGYHLLSMIMQNIELYDELDIKEIEEGIVITCNKSFIPTDERNLAYKAARLFLDTYNIKSGVSIDIIKNIPVAAGLAGGSADCATVLKMLNKMFKVNASEKELMRLGEKLGADVPYCIKGGTALCEGIGEKLTPIKPFKDKIVILVKPPFGVSTKDVYKAFDLSRVKIHPDTQNLIKKIEEDDLYYVASNMKNLLENVTIRKHKVLYKLKENLIKNGAIGSMMSGSGPTVFAFFDDMQVALKCYDELKEKYTDVFLTRTI